MIIKFYYQIEEKVLIQLTGQVSSIAENGFLLIQMGNSHKIGTSIRFERMKVKGSLLNNDINGVV
ncbi:hypothetical protein AM499_05680 [Bacillus sp. FJAT-22090]|nr:hypothetical protein AM499_05680 [Bacillus sp. FJAT-22090]